MVAHLSKDPLRVNELPMAVIPADPCWKFPTFGVRCGPGQRSQCCFGLVPALGEIAACVPECLPENLKILEIGQRHRQQPVISVDVGKFNYRLKLLSRLILSHCFEPNFHLPTPFHDNLHFS